ncbi:MAG: head GIN domain-containing protein [Casimicrobiaceae bacterium]|jgi:hypothetical protein
MKRSVLFLLLLMGLAAAVGVALTYDFWKDTTTGGDALMEEHALPPFKRVAIEGFADVTLVQGGTESITVEGARRQLRRMQISVKDGTLRIASHQAQRWWQDMFAGSARPARVTLNLRVLDAIAVEGAVKVRSDQLKSDRLAVSAAGATSVRIAKLEAKELAVDGSGAIKMEIAGRTIAQTIEISGAGDYRAADLASETAKVTVSGAGRVAVRVDKTLDVALSGAATVEYVGDPKVTRQISGVGRVKRRDATSTPQWTQNVAAAGIDSGLNSSGKPVPSVRSACTPARVLMSVTRQSRSRSTSMATTSPARSSG